MSVDIEKQNTRLMLLQQVRNGELEIDQWGIKVRDPRTPDEVHKIVYFEKFRPPSEDPFLFGRGDVIDWQTKRVPSNIQYLGSVAVNKDYIESFRFSE